MPANWSIAVWSISDDHLYSFTGRTNRSVACGSSDACGAFSMAPPWRRRSNPEGSAPTSHGSLMLTAVEPGNARFTAENIVSTVGSRWVIDVIQWAGELV